MMTPLALLLLTLATSVGHSLQKELPSWFLTCKKDEEILFSCLRKLFVTLKPQLPKGIEAMDIPPVEPLVIPIVLMEEAKENTTYKAKIRDLKVYGISNYEVRTVSLNIREGLMRLTLAMPVLKLVGNYEVKGTFKDRPIDGFGKFVTNFVNFEAFIMVEAGITEKSDGQMFRMEDTQVTIEMERAKGYLTNTYKGDIELYERTNHFLEACALDMVREVKPAVEMIIAMLVSDIGNKIPTFTPYALLFSKS